MTYMWVQHVAIYSQNLKVIFINSCVKSNYMLICNFTLMCAPVCQKKGLNIKWHSEDKKYGVFVFLEKFGVCQNYTPITERHRWK
jgi:hypothetical protein